MTQPNPSPADAAPRKRGFWSTPNGIGLAVGGLIAAVVVGLVVLGGSGDMETQMTSCKLNGSDTLPAATVGLTVHNTGSVTRTVRVKLEFRDSDGTRLDTDTAVVRDVAPGDTARTEETTLLDAAPSGTLTCLIVD